MNRAVAILNPAIEVVAFEDRGEAISSTSLAVLIAGAGIEPAIGARIVRVFNVKDGLAGINKGLHLCALIPVNALLVDSELYYLYNVLDDRQRIFEPDRHAVARCLPCHPLDQVNGVFLGQRRAESAPVLVVLHITMSVRNVLNILDSLR